MYSIQKAAAILGIAKPTVRAWMKQCGLKTKIVETDRRRAYITDDDMVTLVGRSMQKAKRREEKTNMHNRNSHNRNSKEVTTIGEGKYYSLAGAASILRVSVTTVKRWSEQDNIERTLFTTDTTRAYIAKDDVVRLAELHRCKLSDKVFAELRI